MRIEEVSSKTTVNEGLVLHKIGLDPSKIGFIQEIMRSKIYTYPVLACVREVLTNALDASKKVGKDASTITVHLPTRSEPYFSVKDEGIGMSKEVFLKYFAEYGNSLASDSNEFTGCYGLGSKAPFTIANSFKVLTSWEGERYSYVCFITNEGNNAVVLSSQLKSSTVGTEIVIEDIDKYITDIVSSYYNLVYLWDVKPKCNIEVLPREVFLSGNGWEIINNNDITCSDKLKSIINADLNYSFLPYKGKLFTKDVIFLMGGVPYSFRREDIVKLSERIEDPGQHNIKSFIDIVTTGPSSYYAYRSNYKKTIVFHCDIGSISISPQREYIDVDKSLDFIRSKFNFMMKEVQEVYNKKINNCKDIIEASIVNSSLGHLSLSRAIFKGVVIPKNNYLSFKFKTYRTGIEKGKTIRRHESSIRIDEDLNIIVDNVNSIGSSIPNIRNILIENDFYKCFIVNTGTMSKESIIEDEKFLDPELYPAGRILFLSDLVKPKKKKKSSAKVRVSTLIDKEEYSFLKSKDFKDSLKPLSEPKVYFPVSTWRSTYKELYIEDIKAIQKVFNTTIFGVSNADLVTVHNAGWSYWKDEYEDLIEENKSKMELAYKKIINYCKSNYLNNNVTNFNYEYFKKGVIFSDNLIGYSELEKDWAIIKAIASKDKSLASSKNYIIINGFINLLEEIRSEFRSNPISLFPNIHMLDKSFGITSNVLNLESIVKDNIRARIIFSNKEDEERQFLLNTLFEGEQ